MQHTQTYTQTTESILTLIKICCKYNNTYIVATLKIQTNLKIIIILLWNYKINLMFITQDNEVSIVSQ